MGAHIGAPLQFILWEGIYHVLTATVRIIVAQKFFIDGSSLQTFRTGRNRRFPAKYDGKPVLIIDI